MLTRASLTLALSALLALALHGTVAAQLEAPAVPSGDELTGTVAGAGDLLGLTDLGSPPPAPADSPAETLPGTAPAGGSSDGSSGGDTGGDASSPGAGEDGGGDSPGPRKGSPKRGGDSPDSGGSDAGGGSGRASQEAPPPQAGRSVSVEPVSGDVQIKPAGSDEFAPLDERERIPLGSTVDASDGSVELTATAAGGRTQSAVFYDGTFKVLQTRARLPVTVLELVGGRFDRCRGAGREARAGGLLARSAAARPVRRLWGNGRGLFLTRGRYSSASVRGTVWLTEDRCTGTFTRVRRGTVLVCDFTNRRRIVLKAGKSYLARARKGNVRARNC